MEKVNAISSQLSNRIGSVLEMFSARNIVENIDPKLERALKKALNVGYLNKGEITKSLIDKAQVI